MSTSGTVGSTVIATDVVLSHAMRRCGVAATAQTPEIVELASECLFLLLLSLSSRGINLWLIDKPIIESIVGQKTYVLPPGTLDILTGSYSTVTYATGTNTSAATSYQVALTTASTVSRVAVTFSALPTSDVTLQFSDDGMAWTTATTVPVNTLPATSVRAWFDMNIVGSHAWYRVYAGGATLTATEMLLCATVNDLTMSKFNRDDYAAQPNKDSPGSPAVNYLFEKLVNPQVTLWPVPNIAGNQFWFYRHRQVQDVGSLTQTLELPSRWFEDIIWQLAGRLCFELPTGTVDKDRMTMVLGAANDATIIVESGESDGSPSYIVPNIRGYTA